MSILISQGRSLLLVVEPSFVTQQQGTGTGDPDDDDDADESDEDDADDADLPSNANSILDNLGGSFHSLPQGPEKIDRHIKMSHSPYGPGPSGDPDGASTPPRPPPRDPKGKEKEYDINPNSNGHNRLYGATSAPTSLTAFQFPPAMKLKGEENYQLWKARMIDLVTSNGLEKYISVRHCSRKPKEVDFDDTEATD